MLPSACRAADYKRNKYRQINMYHLGQYILVGNPCACWWSVLCQDKRGLVPWGIRDSQLPKGGKESRASAVFKVISVEGAGFKPEALKCSVASEWLGATLLSFGRGHGG